MLSHNIHTVGGGKVDLAMDRGELLFRGNPEGGDGGARQSKKLDTSMTIV